MENTKRTKIQTKPEQQEKRGKMCSAIQWLVLEGLIDTWSVEFLEKSVKTAVAKMYRKNFILSQKTNTAMKS